MSSTMNIMGTYSGITMDTIDQLVQAESAKVVRYTNEQEGIRQEQAAWKDVQTRLTNLSNKLSDLMKMESFESKKVTTSPEGKVVFGAGATALSGDYSISVEQLATRTQVTGAKLDGVKVNEPWGQSGTFTIASVKVGEEAPEEPVEIVVNEGDSLESVIDQINEKSKDSGVSAVMIDNRIVLQSKDFGEREIQLTNVEGNVTESLGLNGAKVDQGQSAKLTVNGIEIERDSNQITDVMEGVTFELRGVTTEDVQVKVVDDLDKAAETVKAFVDQYNSTLSFIAEQLDVGDPTQEDNKTGALSGDSSLMRLQSQLRSLLTQPVDNGNTGVNTASSIGITVDRYGTATLDAEKLKEALQEDSQKVMEFFAFTKTTEAGEEEIGLSQKFNTLLNSFTDSKDGIIATKNETYDKMIKDLTKRIDTFNERLEVKRQQYIEKFTALDIAMMEAESQLSYLMSQVGTNNNNN